MLHINAFSVRVEIREDTVPEHRKSHGANVVRRDGETAV
jgi:hypothetical protein